MAITLSNNQVSFSENQIVSELARRSFWFFVTEFWESVPGTGVMVPNWHMELLADELQAMAERVFSNAPKAYDCVVNIPPGTSKSTIASILFPAWVWTRMPCARVLSASHTDALVMDLAAKAREVITSDKYKACYPDIVLSDVQDAKGYYRNTLGGDRFTCTVAGKTPTGFHAHFIIIDDPIDPQRVTSEAETKTAKDFVTNVLPTRKVDKAVTVTFLIMQRLGVNDPTAVMLEASQRDGAAPVRHICLPSEIPVGEDGAAIESDCPVSPPELAKRYVNGLLDPGRLSEQVLREFRARGSHFYATQFLQKPYAAEGGMFQLAWFNNTTLAAPMDSYRVRFWDRAATQDGGCYTAGVLMARSQDGRYFVEHVVHGQWETYRRNAIMKATALRDRNKYGPKHEPMIYVEAEGGSSGRDAWKEVARVLAGYNIREARVSGSKDVRAEPWSAQLASGNVLIVNDKTWDMEGYVQEHVRFKPDPTTKRLGRYKDQVDASSGAFNVLAAYQTARTLRVYHLGDSKSKSLRLVSCSYEQVACLVEDEQPSLLIHLTEPGLSADPPPHGLGNIQDTITLQFADIQPSEYQESWETPLPGLNLLPEQAMFNRDQGKALWRFLLKARMPYPWLWVFASPSGKRALSLALAVSDVFRVAKESKLWVPGREEGEGGPLTPPNGHVYEMGKLCRSLIVT